VAGVVNLVLVLRSASLDTFTRYTQDTSRTLLHSMELLWRTENKD